MLLTNTQKYIKRGQNEFTTPEKQRTLCQLFVKTVNLKWEDLVGAVIVDLSVHTDEDR